jgi:hypothetical protein
MRIEVGDWRKLTAGELAAEPDASFGGVIAVIFLAALFALTPLAFLIVGGARDSQGTTWVLLMMLRQAFGGDMKSAYIASSMAQMLTLLVWAATFVAVTLVRARSGPTIAAVVFAIAALVGPVGQCAIIMAYAGDKGGTLQAAAQLPHMVLNLVAAVTFWAYMHEGRRPNLYFRRRARVVAAAGARA